MYELGETVLVVRAYELLGVKGIETLEGDRTIYLFGRPEHDERQPLTADELTYPFGRKRPS
jgi:hypothetical protein